MTTVMVMSIKTRNGYLLCRRWLRGSTTMAPPFASSSSFANSASTAKVVNSANVMEKGCMLICVGEGGEGVAKTHGDSKYHKGQFAETNPTHPMTLYKGSLDLMSTNPYIRDFESKDCETPRQ